MARSIFIFIVTLDGAPVGAFTVKRELVGWLQFGGAVRPEDVRVIRMYDGQPGGPSGNRPTRDLGTGAQVVEESNRLNEAKWEPHE